MDFFNYRGRTLFAEDVNLLELADEHGTPCYVYSRATLERHWRAFDDAFGDYPHLICYAVKANSNLAVLNVLARLGSGFDIVSVGELERVLKAGGRAEQIVFSGVGKRVDELERSLEVDIGCFNVESAGELELLQSVARRMGKTAPVSIRVNPDVDPDTHPYISTGLRDNKFGVPIDEAVELYRRAHSASHLQVHGVDCHIGSQITSLSPYMDAVDRVLRLVEELATQEIHIRYFNAGGGLGIRYRDEDPPPPQALVQSLVERVQSHQLVLHLEPGRAVAGNAGLLLTRVQYLKHNEDKSFAVVDAAMNDLIRPALYEGWHQIVPVEQPTEADGKACSYDVVGPVCESSDFLGKQRELTLVGGELLAVRTAGAYSFVMSSNYNGRPRAPEIMVDGDQVHVVRERERVADLFASESLLP